MRAVGLKSTKPELKVREFVGSSDIDFDPMFQRYLGDRTWLILIRNLLFSSIGVSGTNTEAVHAQRSPRTTSSFGRKKSSRIKREISEIFANFDEWDLTYLWFGNVKPRKSWRSVGELRQG